MRKQLDSRNILYEQVSPARAFARALTCSAAQQVLISLARAVPSIYSHHAGHRRRRQGPLAVGPSARG